MKIKHTLASLKDKNAQSQHHRSNILIQVYQKQFICFIRTTTYLCDTQDQELILIMQLWNLIRFLICQKLENQKRTK